MSGVWQFLRWASVLAGSLSLVLLIKQGFEIGLVGLLQGLLQFYSSWVEALLGWAEPPIRAAVTQLGAIWGQTLELNREWKHILIAYAAVFGGLLRAFFARSMTAGCIFVVLLLAVVAVSVTAPAHVESPVAGVGLMLVGLALVAYSMLGKMGGASSFAIALLGLSAIPMGGLFWLGPPGLALGVALAIIWFLVFATISFGGRLSLETLKGYAEFAAAPLAAIAFMMTNAGLKFANL